VARAPIFWRRDEFHCDNTVKKLVPGGGVEPHHKRTQNPRMSFSPTASCLPPPVQGPTLLFLLLFLYTSFTSIITTVVNLVYPACLRWKRFLRSRAWSTSLLTLPIFYRFEHRCPLTVPLPVPGYAGGPYRRRACVPRRRVAWCVAARVLHGSASRPVKGGFACRALDILARRKRLTPTA